jgi:hypothetical protein
LVSKISEPPFGVKVIALKGGVEEIVVVPLK